MKVVIRADSSYEIGTGHIMRCLTLAKAMRKAGNLVYFICRELDGNINSYLDELGFNVIRLHGEMETPTGQAAEGRPQHHQWLHTTWEHDAEQTKKSISTMGERPDWVIVDHYGLDIHWQLAIRCVADRIFVIDDLADRQHDCEVLLDQNLHKNMAMRYNRKVPGDCVKLLGPDYAMLQAEYESARKESAPRSGHINRILIYFGGADQQGLTKISLEAALEATSEEVTIDVVCSLNSPDLKTIEEIAKCHANVQLHCGLPSLAPLILKADLAIGASGATSWERCLLGLPTIVITLALNQLETAEELHNQGIIDYLGYQDDVTIGMLTKRLKYYIDEGLDIEWSQRCTSIVDGQGTQRVLSALNNVYNNKNPELSTSEPD